MGPRKSSCQSFVAVASDETPREADVDTASKLDGQADYQT